MIYVSSYCIKAETIKESVTNLAEAGFKNIELSGGTKYYPEYENDLFRLQDKYELNYQVHNYFPPPTKAFILNLASLNDDVYEQSINLCNNAIILSKKLGGRRYGVHAGFLIDFKPKEIGKKISLIPLNKRHKAIKRFCEAWDVLSDNAGDEVSLYIENNVLSSTNAKTFSGNNPLLLTGYKGYLELKEHFDFNLLLDVAHLKVSAKSLGLDFENELKIMLPETDYIHISDNDGLHDQNKSIKKGSNILKALNKYDSNGKIYTLETYCSITEIKNTHTLVEKVITN